MIVTQGTLAVRAAQAATGTIPIVMAFAGDPVGIGAVASLARPGGNVTGLSLLDTDLDAKRIELLQQAVPGLSRAAVLWRATDRFVDAGGLMGYGPSLADLFRRSATYVDTILRGARPADLPVELPTKFEFVINLRTARALGLTIPPSLIVRADEVLDP